MSSAVIGVLIVDDQAPFRLAARAVVRRIDAFDVVGEADSGETAVAQVAALGPGLVLMDINMGDMDGLEATRRITSAHPETVVFLCSTYAESELPAGSMDCGAAAYINKEELTPGLVEDLWVRHSS